MPHTTGEWKASGAFSIQAGDKLIAMSCIKDVRDPEERESNMKLMAAAPGLMEALGKIKIIAANGLVQDVLDEIYEVAKAAIQKAT